MFVPYLLLVPGFASVGVMVAVRRRATGSTDSFLGIGLIAALTGFGFQYALRTGVTAPGSPPAGWLLAAVAGWTWPLSLAGLGFVLLFPNGGLPAVAALAAAGLGRLPARVPGGMIRGGSALPDDVASIQRR